MARDQQIDTIARHRRSLDSYVAAIREPRNYIGTIRALRICEAPVDFLSRYIRNAGEYPATIRLRDGDSRIALRVYTSDDIQTINEIFFRGDYETAGDFRVVVDFGSNIGISAVYFLTRDPRAYVYGFEPLPQNIERFGVNLLPYAGRFELAGIAVGEVDGRVRFGWEPTGRYGGVNRNTGRWIDVECRDSNAILREIVDRHGRIDVLKIDIETLEKAVTERIPNDLACRIDRIIVEYPFAANPLRQTHRMERRKSVTVFHRLGTD